MIPDQFKRNYSMLDVPLDPDRRGSTVGNTIPTPKLKHRLASAEDYTDLLSHDERATWLNMDHVFMNFYDFMWCGFFVIPPMILGALIGGPNTSGVFGLLRLKLFR